MTALPQRGGAIAEGLICRAGQHDPDKVSFAEVITVNEFNEYVRESFSTAGDIMIIGGRNQSRIRLISLPNDKFGSE